MKLAILNTAVVEPTFGEVDTDSIHFKERCYYLVEDDYDFVGNNATEVTGTEATEWISKLLEYNRTTSPYEIEDDIEGSIAGKTILHINYKSELKSGIAYTPVYVIHASGPNAGFIEKTEYYRGFVDDNNKGTLVLTVEESYVIDESDPTLDHTAKPATSRTKTWKHSKKSGKVDDTNIKVKTKKYDTRRKRHIEGVRRRENVVEQLIDNVGLAGVVSGTFADVSDAHEKLTALQELHASSFSGWKSSGRGSLVTVVQADATTTWLDDTIPDNASTQAMCPWMIGLTFRSYIQDKLKGNIA